MKSQTVISVTIAVAFAAICVVYLRQVQKASQYTSTPPRNGAVIESGFCVGDVRKGMTMDQVIEKLGEPDHREKYILEYRKLGFATISSKDGVIRTVMCGDPSGMNKTMQNAFTGRTKEGIGMGSTKEQVVTAYGDKFETMPLQKGKEPLSGRETMVYKSFGLTFALNNERVHHIIVEFHVSKDK